MADKATISGSGACVTSRNALHGRGRIRWMVREEPAHPTDNGWRVWSEIDDADYLDDPDNLVVVDYDELCDLEPLLVAIHHFPVGSDLQIVDDGGRRVLLTADGREVPEELFFVPPGDDPR